MTEARAVGETGLTEEDFMATEKPKLAALAATGSFPAFAKLISEVDAVDLDFDLLFETGLRVFLDGVEGLASRHYKNGPRRAPKSYSPPRQ